MANRISVIVDASTAAAQKSFKSLRQEVAQTEGQFNKMKVGTAGVFDMLKSSGLGAAAAIGAVAKGAQASVEAASNLAESMNAVDVTFGSASESIHELGEESVESFGLSQRAFNDAAVQFSAFAKTVAGPGGDVSKTMDDLITRATDFASVMNLDLNEAMQVFQSTLAGETEPIRKFGKDVSAAAVEQYALANGLIASKSEMTEAIKVQARYGLLMEQTSDVAGDFENTQGSLANQQKILGAMVEDLAASLGDELLPAVEDAVGGLTDLLGVAKDLKILAAASWLREWANPLTHIANVTSAARGETDLLGREYRNVSQAAWDYATAQEALGKSFGDALYEFEEMSASAADGAISQRALTDAAHETTDGFLRLDEELIRTNTAQNLVAESIDDANFELERQAVRLGVAEEASKEWADGITAATDQGADGFAEFTSEAFGSIDAFQQELYESIVGTSDWKDNLVTIAGQTSGEFATYLAELGPAAAGVVADLANNSGELQDTFNLWTVGAGDASRDIVAEFQEVEPGVQEALGRVDATTESRRIGRNVAEGIASGISSGSSVISQAATRAVGTAMGDIRKQYGIKSPSKEFADKVGKPISQGIAEGIEDDADKIADSLVKAIEGAEKDAVKAAESLVDAAAGGLDDAWGEIDAGRSKADMVENIADAEEALAEAIKDGDPDKIADARERLEDANYRLAKATEYMITKDAESRASWIATAEAGGISRDMIDVLIERHESLAAAAKASLDAQLAASAKSVTDNGTVALFNKHVGEGLVSQGQLDWVNAGKTTEEKLAGMAGINTNLAAMFPGGGGGGVTPGPTINLTVNGAIDPNGTARAIVDALATAKRNGMQVSW